MMNRVANETQDTSNNIMRELGDQKEKIQNQINMVPPLPPRAMKSADRSRLPIRRHAR